jgi:hypothetical protein
MKIFVIREVVWGHGIQEYEAEPFNEFPRPNCVKVKHNNGSISFFDLGLDAFETRAEAERKGSEALYNYIEELEEKKREIESSLEKAKQYYFKIVNLPHQA